MPIVSESRSAPTTNVPLVRYTGDPYVGVIPVGETKSQTGFRSGPLSKEQHDGIDGSRSNTWGDSLRVIQGLEYEYNSRPTRQASIVNQRDYEEKQSKMSVFDWRTSTPRSGGGSPYEDEGTSALGLQAFIPSNWGSVGLNTLNNEAAGMMRRSIPTAPAFNLVRALGELRDFPRALHPGNYVPRTGSEVAGAYLNMVFGLQPTASDLVKAANAVVDSDKHIREFLHSERQQLRRSQSHVRDEYHGTDTPWNPSGTSTSSGSISIDSMDWGKLTMYAPPSGRDIFGLRGSPWSVMAEVHAIATLRQFATWEFFIPRPTGFPGRLDSYRRQAEQVVGSGLSASTVYDLTPWTWLGNWFADVGGLLRYQESVASNSVVASRSGWVYEIKSKVNTWLVNSNFPVSGRELSGYPMFSCTAKKQTRRAGGPYGILQPWSLSSGQTAILSALAIGRYSPL